MLSDPAPYSHEASPAPARLCASTIAPISSIVKKLGLKGARKHKSNAAVTPGFIPDPTGFDLPSAIAMLEKAGYNVAAVKGTGYVRGITPAAGTPARKGTPVSLSLSWK